MPDLTVARLPRIGEGPWFGQHSAQTPPVGSAWQWPSAPTRATEGRSTRDAEREAREAANDIRKLHRPITKLTLSPSGPPVQVLKGWYEWVTRASLDGQAGRARRLSTLPTRSNGPRYNGQSGAR